MKKPLKKILTIEVETHLSNKQLKQTIKDILPNYINKVIQIQVNKIK